MQALETAALRPGWRAAPEREATENVSITYDEAFTRSYQTYYTRVFAFVYSRVGNVELAKDLTAEVFEKAYLKGHDVRQAEAYATWMFTIARNAIVGHFRKRKRDTNCLNRVQESMWLSERPPDPEERALQSDRVDRLMAQLRRLSERDQELLTLKFEGELTYAEIGRVLKMSEVNVRVSTFRALRRLRDLMEKEKSHEAR